MVKLDPADAESPLTLSNSISGMGKETIIIPSYGFPIMHSYLRNSRLTRLHHIINNKVETSLTYNPDFILINNRFTGGA